MVAGRSLLLALLPISVVCSSQSSSSTPQINFRLTTAEQRAAFERDGYIVVRGLLDPKTVTELVSAGEDEYQKGAEHYRQQAADGKTIPGGKNVQVNRVALTNGSTFQDVALYSDIPKVVAELMQLDPSSQSLRLIHDFFFSRNILDPVKCDWHVDGHGLWPESYETPSPASQASGTDQDGINAWIALDDMPVEYEGSMAVSAGSHRVPWRYDAYRAIGRDGTANGGETWQEFVERSASGRGMVTHPEQGPRIRLCSLGVTAPDLCAKMEERKRVLDLKAGDVVFCTRNLFHRTLDVTDAGRKHLLEMGKTNLHRYTIRYTTGSAELPTGFCWFEWSIALHPDIAGWSLDKVADDKKKPYWFPKVWPVGPNRDRLQALVPHIEEAKKNIDSLQAKLIVDVAAAKEEAGVSGTKSDL